MCFFLEYDQTHKYLVVFVLVLIYLFTAIYILSWEMMEASISPNYTAFHKDLVYLFFVSQLNQHLYKPIQAANIYSLISLLIKQNSGSVCWGGG